jgi:glucokinase
VIALRNQYDARVTRVNVSQLAGVYLAGGIALHLVDLLQKPQFVQTFSRKGRLKELM